MTRQEAIERFTAKLTTTIGDFFDGLSESDEEESAYSEMKLIGNDLARLMAKSAMATWEASVDAQVFLEEQGYLKDS